MNIGPRYRQIFNELKEEIDSGKILAGDRIPSTSELCKKYNCSVVPVNTALLLLQDAGYIVGIPGLGRFVTSA